MGEGQLHLGGLFVMIASTILGMGVPGVAAYVIVAAVAVLVPTGVGVMPMAAHIPARSTPAFSNITPPVAMSSDGGGPGIRIRPGHVPHCGKLRLTGFILPFFS